MAPETVRTMEITRFSDIWSLGCTIIEMATGINNSINRYQLGNPPWIDHKNPIDVLYGIYNMKKPPKIPKKISKEMRDFIKCCLKIEPKMRWNVHKLLRHPFVTGDSINPYSNKNDFEVRFNSGKSGR
jgi:serine/threonine protein kinase